MYIGALCLYQELLPPSIFVIICHIVHRGQKCLVTSEFGVCPEHLTSPFVALIHRLSVHFDMVLVSVVNEVYSVFSLFWGLAGHVI